MRTCVLAVRTLRHVLTRKRLALFIVVGSVMHAAGHTFLAALGGVLARGLAASMPRMDDARSTLGLERLGFGDALVGLAIAGLFAALAKLVGGVMAAWAESRLAGEVAEALRLEVLDGVLHGVHALRHPRHGDQGARLASLTTHVGDVERGVAHGVLAEARATVQLAPLVVLLFVLAPRLAGSAAAALVAFGVLVTATRRALRRGHARAAKDAEALVSAADEAVKHAELWATYGAERTIRAHVASLGRTIVATASRLRARAALLSGTSEVLGALALVLVLVLVSAGAIGGVDRGGVVPFAIAFFMAYKPLRELVDARLARGRGEEALRAALAASETTEARPASPPRAWPLADLVVEGLVTEHGAHAPLSLRVPAGTVAALVGPTGVGKTSVLRALLGLDRPRAGSIRYGAEPLDDRGVGPGERPFAWVQQHAPVLAATIDENVALGAPRAIDARAILADVGACSFAGSDAVLVTERALSGGERQQVAAARALATELPVLLLDEPTSALDPDAQRAMLDAIGRLRGRRTVIVVTHRAEPLAVADVVVRLEPEDREDRARRDRDRVGAEQLAVEDVGALSSGEAKDRAGREGVDRAAE